MTRLNSKFFLGVVLLVLSVSFAGASGDDEAAAAGAPDVLRFSAYIGTPDAEAHISEWPSQIAIMEAAEAYMGMEIEMEWDLMPPADMRDREAVYLASGDFHDVFAPGSVESQKNLGALGQIINLLDYEDQLVNYKAWLGNENDNLTRAGFDTGEIWGFAYGQASPNDGSQWVWAARLDKFQEHDITPPETLDDQRDVLAQFKALYPQSYPMDSYVTANWYSLPRLMMLANRVDWGIYYDGNKYVYGPIESEKKFRQALEYMNVLYEEGLVQPEFFSQPPDDLSAKALEGRTFIVPNQFALNVVNRFMSDDHPDVVWGNIPRPRAFDGQPGWKPNINKKGNNFIRVNAALNAEFEYPELLVKLIDYAFSPEVIDFANWGIPGTTYNVDSDGKKTWAPLITDLTGQDRSLKLAEYGAIGSGYGYPRLANPTVLDWGARGPLWETALVYGGGQYFVPESVFAFSALYDGAPRPHEYRPIVQLSVDELATEREIITAVNTVVEEGALKLITGTRTFDEWDSFIQEIRDAGDFQSVVDTYNSYL